MEWIRCRELASSSSFCSTIYSEIEEVGWEHLVRLGEDLTFLSFRILDKKGRTHTLEIVLDETYPKSPPSISADVPCMFDLEWSIKSRLKDVVHQFQQHLGKLEEFWSTLDSIDQSLLVVDPEQAHHATTHRLINIGNDCFLMLLIDALDPRSLPECRFIGSDPKVNALRQVWRRNCKRWMKNKTLPENLAITLETQLPGPPNIQKNDQQIECGICYAQCLPIGNVFNALLHIANLYIICLVILVVLIQMMNWELKVEVALIILVTTAIAVGLSIVFVLGIGCVPSPLRDSHLMFCLGIVLTVQSRLQLKLTLRIKPLFFMPS